MERLIKGTGVFAGISVPESYRGKFILICNGKIVKCADSAEDLYALPAARGSRAVVLAIPEDDHAVAAY